MSETRNIAAIPVADVSASAGSPKTASWRLRALTFYRGFDLMLPLEWRSLSVRPAAI
jgi:hypothetical protein